jgi:hypothetical protein
MAHWVAALAFLGAAKAIVVGLALGARTDPLFAPVARQEAAIVGVYLVLGGVLTVRFAARKVTRAEASALILFVLATCAEVLFGTWIPGLLIGISGLLIARLLPNTFISPMSGTGR